MADSGRQKHTPGPWQVETDFCDCGGDYPCAHGEYPVSIVSQETQKYGLEGQYERRKIIADFGESDYLADMDVAEANATLMAQAPAMQTEIITLTAKLDQARAALEEIVRYDEGIPESIDESNVGDCEDRSAAYAFKTAAMIARAGLSDIEATEPKAETDRLLTCLKCGREIVDDGCDFCTPKESPRKDGK
jgi:hypothetical protein